MSDSVRVAGIDCGTNSIRLMIADVNADGLHVVFPKRLDVVRLGEGVDRTHRFSPAALERTFAACRDYARLIEQYRADTVCFVATSASRDARNRQDVEDGVERILGVQPRIISGQTEARLSFLGATSVMNARRRADASPVLVIDLGGGSTELVLGGAGQRCDEIQASVSMDIGCVRISERHLPSDPPTEQEIAAAVEDIDSHLRQALETVPLGKARTVIGVSGTVTTMSLIALGERAYSRHRVDGAIIGFGPASDACRLVAGLSRAGMEEYPVIHPDRRDVVIGGSLIWSRLLACLSEETAKNGQRVDSYIASEKGLLEGSVLETGWRLLQDRAAGLSAIAD